MCFGEDVGRGKEKGDEDRIGKEREGGGHTVGVTRFGKLNVRYSIGLSCRWHLFGRINQ